MITYHLKILPVQVVEYGAQNSHYSPPPVPWHLIILSMVQLIKFLDVLKRRGKLIPGRNSISSLLRNSGGHFHLVKPMTYCGLFDDRPAPDEKAECRQATISPTTAFHTVRS